MSDVTRLLQAIDQGDAQASGELLPLVYDELRKLAAAAAGPGEAGPDAAGHGPGPRGVSAAGGRRRGASTGTAAATSSPPRPRPCGGFSSRTPAASSARSTAASSQRVELDELAPGHDDARRPTCWRSTKPSTGWQRDDPQAAELVKLRFFAGLTIDGGGRAARHLAREPPTRTGLTPGPGCAAKSRGLTPPAAACCARPKIFSDFLDESAAPIVALTWWSPSTMSELPCPHRSQHAEDIFVELDRPRRASWASVPRRSLRGRRRAARPRRGAAPRPRRAGQLPGPAGRRRRRRRPLDSPSSPKAPARSSAPTSCCSRSAKAAWAWCSWPSRPSRSSGPVALKIIKPGMDTRQVIARFEAERQAAGADGPSEHRPRARRRHDRHRPALLRDGAGEGRADHRVLRPAAPSDPRAAGAVRRRLPGGAARPSERHHPPRPQALERAGGRIRRQARPQGHRLRRRQGDRASG